MAKVIYNNPAFGSIPKQTQYGNLPDLEGQIFNIDDKNIYGTVQGGKLYEFSPLYASGRGLGLSDNTPYLPAGFSPEDVGLSSGGLQTYNRGDLKSAFARDQQTSLFNPASKDMFKNLSSAPIQNVTIGDPNAAPVQQPSQLGGTVQAAFAPAPQASSIPFKDGLSETQKQKITTLAQKPLGQWNATDKANWSYATNNAPLPGSMSGVSTASMGQPLTPAQYNTLRTQYDVTPSTFNQYFERKGTDIYLKSNLPNVPSVIDTSMIERGSTFDPSSIAKTPTSATTGKQILAIGQSALNGLNQQLLELQNQRQTAAEDERKALEAENKKLLEDKIIGGGQSLSSVRQTIFDKYQLDENIKTLTDIKNKITSEVEMANLGIANEEDRLASVGIIGRRQAKLQQQANIRIASLSSAAQVLQGNVDLAMRVADLAIQDYSADRQDEISAYKTLIELNRNKIVDLKATEKDSMNAQISLIEEEVKKLEENKNKVMELIVSNPQEAVKAGITFSTPYEEAVQRMLPYIQSADEKALVLDMAKQYDDAGILPTDSLTVAQSKMKNSKIYQQKTRLAGGGGSGSNGGSSTFDYDAVKSRLEDSKDKSPESDGYVNTDVYKKERLAVKDKTSFDKSFSWMLNPNDPSAKEFFTATEIKNAGKTEWGVVNEKTGKTPEESLMELGIDQSLIDTAQSMGLSPEDLMK